MQIISSIFTNSFRNCANIFICAVFFISLNILNAKGETSEQSLYLENKLELNKVENFLNNIENLSANFIQISEEQLSEGKFYLKRYKNQSGKMRVEYKNDPKILIIVNGSILNYIDLELEETSELSTNTTPASLLTRPNIKFDAKDVKITRIEKGDNFIKISLMKKNEKNAGEFSLKFQLNPLQFEEMEVKNDLDQVTKVILSDLNFKSAIADSEFIAFDKRKER